MTTTIALQTIGCESTRSQSIKAAQEFPARLFAVHGDKIIFRDNATYKGRGAKDSSQIIEVKCTVCNHEWNPLPHNLLKGKGCPNCSAQRAIEAAGKVRRPKGTDEEKLEALLLREEGQSYGTIAETLGHSASTIRRWLDPKQNDKSLIYNYEYRKANRERYRANTRRYISEFAHGKASHRAAASKRDLLKRNIQEYVFLDNEWQEVDREATWEVFGEVLLPASERKAIQELYLEAQYQTETTGIEHHLDHIHPLSKGGEHNAINLQVITKEENLSKNNKFPLEDQVELCRRLFNIN